jgi:phospholipid/cholesterol/gamma-HCH transport system substrate-binding protein
MPTSAQKARLGLFLFTGTALIVALLVATVGYTNEIYATYYLAFDESVNGISEGSQVKYRGLPVGAVRDMRIEPDNSILIEIAVQPSRLILHQGTRARLDRSSLVGAVFVQLEGGDPHNGPLPSGAQIETLPSLGKQIADDLPAIIRDASMAIARINETLEAISRDQLGMIVDEADSLVTSVQGAVDETREQLSATIVEARGAVASLNEAGKTVVSAAETVDRVIGNLEQPVKGVIATVDRTVEGLDLEATAESLRTAVERLDRITIALESTLFDVDQQVIGVGGELIRTLQQVQRLIETIERDPSTVLFGRGAAPAQGETFDGFGGYNLEQE